MSVLCLDIESFYSSKEGYTLSKMTTEEYSRDPKAEILGCGFKKDDGPTVYVPAPQLPQVLRAIPWHETIVLCHNAKFDLFFLRTLYPWLPVPKFVLDTLSMARHLHADQSSSLAHLAKLYRLPPKGDEVVRADGKRFRDFSPVEHRRMAEYCKHDVWLTSELYKLMRPEFPLFEFQLVDLTIKMFIDPVLRLNAQPLIDEIRDEQSRKEKLLQNIDKSDLMSNPKFAELLAAHGYSAPIKPSPTALKDPEIKKRWNEFIATEGISEAAVTPAMMAAWEVPWTYAFGKTDKAMRAMLESDDEDLKTLAEARVGVKSTINESRAGRMLGVAQRGSFPIDLNYCGAHTSRWSGGSRINVQNFPRGSRLREAVIAPPGHKLVVVDLSAIEARVLAYIAGQHDIIQTFTAGGDVYCEMASSLFSRSVTKEDKLERQLGKTLILGCGYALGWKRFAEYMLFGPPKMLLGNELADMLGVNPVAFQAKYGKDVIRLQPPHIDTNKFLVHCAVAKFMVDAYRSKNGRIKAFWKECLAILNYVLAGEEIDFVSPGVVTTSGVGFHAPIGNPLRYIGLRQHSDGSFTRKIRQGEAYISGGLCTENIVQWLSRHILAEQMLTLAKEGIKIALTCHDEIVAVAPDSEAEDTLELMKAVMSMTPVWAPGLPLACEGAVAENYKEAK